VGNTIENCSVLLLARLMGQYCFARCRLSSSDMLPAGRPGAWPIGHRRARGRLGCMDTEWWASFVTSR